MRSFIFRNGARLTALALLVASMGAHALSLGRVRGAVQIGRPLDVVVPVHLEPQDQAAVTCFDADIFYADTRLAPTRVKVEVGPAGPDQWTELRIRSTLPVDEPVVALTLHAGCGHNSMRRYALLADPGDPLQAVHAPEVAPTPPRTAEPVAPQAPATPRRRLMPVPEARMDALAADPGAHTAETALLAATENPSTPAEAGKSRLKLDPMGELSDRVAMLEAQAVDSASQDLVRELQRIQALDADVRALAALAGKSNTSLTDMQARVQKAESERYAPMVVYGLAVLVVGSVLALVWLLRRQRNQPGPVVEWSAHAPVPHGPVLEPDEPLAEPAQASAPPVVHERAPEPAPARQAPVLQPTADVDVSLVELSESNFDQLMQTGSVEGALRKRQAEALPIPEAQAHTPFAARLDDDAVADVHQQAEFLVSLGKADQAVRILERHIQANTALRHPLPYLDLMEIFHNLGLEIDFRQVRADFNRIFRARVPEFALFLDAGRNLDAYPEVLARIGAYWGTTRAVEFIEASLLRDPGVVSQTSFDLAAFRELLVLRAIALEILQAPATPPGGLDLDLSEAHPPLA